MRTTLEQDLDLMCPQIIWEQEYTGKIALAIFKKSFVCGTHCHKIWWRPRN